jgi:hypothetical protein
MNLHEDFGAHRIGEDDVSDFVLNSFMIFNSSILLLR